jgi:acyl carrier protein
MAEGFAVRRAQLALAAPFVAPSSPTEARLARIWASALSMDQVGVEDAYHDLGGDSFLATVIFTAVAEEFGVDAQPSLLAAAPTVAQLALRIDALVGAQGGRREVR